MTLHVMLVLSLISSRDFETPFVKRHAALWPRPVETRGLFEQGHAGPRHWGEHFL